MYWNPMSSWPLWCTTSLAIISLVAIVSLIAFSLREGLRTPSPTSRDLALKGPQEHGATDD